MENRQQELEALILSFRNIYTQNMSHMFFTGEENEKERRRKFKEVARLIKHYDNYFGITSERYGKVESHEK